MIGKSALLALVFIIAAGTNSCYYVHPSRGGGQTHISGDRETNAADVAVPAGFRIEVITTGLTFPTGVTFDENGGVYVVESGYSYGEAWTTPRLLRIKGNGDIEEIARGERNGPWTGVAYDKGNFYIAEGGQMEGGRILRVTPEGRIERLIENLPGRGDHHTNGPVIGKDGKIYFAQGTATNSGIVGEDNAKFGWLNRFKQFHDIPCKDVTLTGRNFESPDVLNKENKAKVKTGAFSPFGTPTKAGQIIKGSVPCSGAVMRANPDGSMLELVAWGFRNPFGLAFAPDGQLYATDNGYDERGSRPVWGNADHLWRVTPNTWYGWPDFSGNLSLEQEDFVPPGGPELQLLLQHHPNPPPEPVAILGVHASSNGLDFSRSDRFGHVGQAFIAEFGDQAPDVGKSMHPVGFRVIRVDVKNGRIEDFAINKSGHGPASKLKSQGLERPLAVRFSPSGDALYVVDFGVLLMDSKGAKSQQSTGVLWKISRVEK